MLGGASGAGESLGEVNFSFGVGSLERGGSAGLEISVGVVWLGWSGYRASSGTST